MGKKVTIRDVASLAQVSVATVSYVLNQKDRQKISEATKTRVFTTAEQLGYKSFALVNTLIAEKNGKIVLFYHDTPNIFKKAQSLDFFERLAAGLHCHNRDLVVIPDSLKTKSSFCEAIVCYDTSARFLQEVKQNNIVPVIGVDVIPQDAATRHVCIVPEAARQEAAKVFGSRDYDVLYFPYADINLNQRFLDVFPNAIPVGDPNDLNEYLNSNSHKPIFAIGRGLFQGFIALGREVVLYEPASATQIENICNTIIAAITEAGQTRAQLLA